MRIRNFSIMYSKPQQPTQTAPQRNHQIQDPGTTSGSSGNPSDQLPYDYSVGPSSSGAGTSGWRNATGQFANPPWMSGSGYTKDKMIAEVVTWVAFTFSGIGGVAHNWFEAIAERFFRLPGPSSPGGTRPPVPPSPGGTIPLTRFGNALKSIGKFFGGHTGGWCWFLSAVCAGIVGSIMFVQSEKEGKRSIRRFFQAFKDMIGADQGQIDFLKTTFAGPSAWASLIEQFWYNAYTMALGITGRNEDNQLFTDEVTKQRYDEGCKNVWGHSLLIFEMLKSFADFAQADEALNAKPDDTDLKTKRDTRLTAMQSTLLRIGRAADIFGNVQGGYPVFLKKAAETSSLVTGFYDHSVSHKAKFDNLIRLFGEDPNVSDAAKGQALEFQTKINDIAKTMGLTVETAEAHSALGKMISLIGYGTADEVWTQATKIYDVIASCPPVNVGMPDYYGFMEIWKARFPDAANENVRLYGLAYPTRTPLVTDKIYRTDEDEA